MQTLYAPPRFDPDKIHFILNYAENLLEGTLARLPRRQEVAVLGANIGKVTAADAICLVSQAISRFIDNLYYPPSGNADEYYYREAMFGLFDGAVAEFITRFPHVPEEALASAAALTAGLISRSLPGQYVILPASLAINDWAQLFKLDRFLLDQEFPPCARHGRFRTTDNSESHLQWLRSEVFRP